MFQYSSYRLAPLDEDDDPQKHGADQFVFSRVVVHGNKTDEASREFFNQDGEWVTEPRDGSVAAFPDKDEAAGIFWDWQVRHADLFIPGKEDGPRGVCCVKGCSVAAAHVAKVGPNRDEYFLCEAHAIADKETQAFNPGPLITVVPMTESFQSAN